MSFPHICTPLRILLICPRGQQCVFDQAPGVLPVRRETIEGIDGGRMQCVHPAGVQCCTRCQVETSRNSHTAAGCNACIQLMRNGCQADAWQYLQHAALVVHQALWAAAAAGVLAEILHAKLNFVTSAERSWCAPSESPAAAGPRHLSVDRVGGRAQKSEAMRPKIRSRLKHKGK